MSRIILGPDILRQQTRRVCLGLCVHRDVTLESMYSIIRALTSEDPKFIPRIERGDALIERSRSILATKFLNDDSEDVLIFIDDDISFNVDDAVRLAADVLDYGMDIVGGCYVTKSEVQPILQHNVFEGEEIILAPDSDPIPVRYVSTGFMAIAKRVLRKMVDESKLPLCMPQSFYPFFATGCKEIDGVMRFLGEDWAFCERARELGFKVWLDPSIRLGHTGKYTYTVEDINRPKRVAQERIVYKIN